jgi:putative oxidoreductase
MRDGEGEMGNGIDQILLAAGRLLLGGLFVFGGVHHLFTMPAILEAMTARGVPAPRLVLLAGSAFQFVAGLLLVLGIWVAPAALGLVVFTIAASVMLLNFWDLEGPAREAARNVWQSNLAIIGGLLIAAAQAI